MVLLKYILWWELRRLLFNGFLLGAALLLCCAFGFNLLKSEPGSADYLLFITYLALILLANLAYTLLYGVYYKKAKAYKLRFILFKRMVLYGLILLILYTIFMLLALMGLFR